MLKFIVVLIVVAMISSAVAAYFGYDIGFEKAVNTITGK
jgi:hypothetical protein